MGLRQLEKWKAHFRFRKELNEDEWAPIADRQLTIEDVRLRAGNAARKLEGWGE
jgi:hypothetical protein